MCMESRRKDLYYLVAAVALALAVPFLGGWLNRATPTDYHFVAPGEHELKFGGESTFVKIFNDSNGLLNISYSSLKKGVEFQKETGFIDPKTSWFVYSNSAGELWVFTGSRLEKWIIKDKITGVAWSMDLGKVSNAPSQDMPQRVRELIPVSK